MLTAPNSSVLAGLGLGPFGLGGHGIQAAGNGLQRMQREVGEEGCDDQREQDRDAGEHQRAVELRHQLLLEKKGRESDANLTEGRALALHGQGDLIDAGRAVHGAKLFDEAAIAQRGERGTVRHDFVDGAGIGIDQGNAVTVDQRRVIDLGVVADDGLQQAGDGVIVLEDCGDGSREHGWNPGARDDCRANRFPAPAAPRGRPGGR